MCGFAPVAIGLSALGTVAQANQARAAGEAANQAAQYNAQVSEAQAIDARQRGEVNVAQIRSRTRQQIGRQTTGLAGAGVDVGSGSALDIVRDTAAFGSLDEQTARSNAMREAYGFRTQATQQSTQGAQAQQAGRNQATGTLLTGAARTFNLWDQMG